MAGIQAKPAESEVKNKIRTTIYTNKHNIHGIKNAHYFHVSKQLYVDSCFLHSVREFWKEGEVFGREHTDAFHLRSCRVVVVVVVVAEEHVLEKGVCAAVMDAEGRL